MKVTPKVREGQFLDAQWPKDPKKNVCIPLKKSRRALARGFEVAVQHSRQLRSHAVASDF